MAKNQDFEEIFDDVQSIVSSMTFEKSHLGILAKTVDEYKRPTIEFCGGLNGNGNWEDYLNELTNLFAKLRRNGFEGYVIKVDNDCLDDVFYLTIGIKRKEHEEK